MAITQVQKPSGFVGVNGRLMIVLSSTNVTEPKFRYKITLNKDVTTVISTAYIDPDMNDFGVYDCSPRLKGLVTPQVHDGNLPATRKNIFDLDAGDCYVDTDGAHEGITVEVQESYAATSTSAPIDQGTPDTFKFTIYNGSTTIEDGLNVNTGRGVMDSVSAQCLTTATLIDSTLGFPTIKLGNDDHFSLAWFNAGENSVAVTKWRMLTTFADTSTAIEDIDVATYTTGNGDGTMLYFMCGPKDLADFTGIAAANRPSASTTWVSYILQPFDSSTAIGGGYLIERDDRGCRYDSYQLAFENIHGAWNYQTFHLLSQKNITVKRGKTYTKQVGSTDYGGGVYGFNEYDREVNRYGIRSSVRIEMNTNWLTREEAEDLESVIYSRNVWMLLNGSSTPVPVTVSNQSHRHDKYKKMRQYKISVDVAQRYYEV